DELRAVGEAVVALHHIIAEADLAHFAVGDDVDTGIALFLHSLGDRFHDSRIKLALIDRLLVDQVPHHAREIRRTGQTAGLRRLYAFGALFHAAPPAISLFGVLFVERRRGTIAYNKVRPEDQSD